MKFFMSTAKMTLNKPQTVGRVVSHSLRNLHVSFVTHRTNKISNKFGLFRFMLYFFSLSLSLFFLTWFVHINVILTDNKKMPAIYFEETFSWQFFIWINFFFFECEKLMKMIFNLNYDIFFAATFMITFEYSKQAS